MKKAIVAGLFVGTLLLGAKAADAAEITKDGQTYHQVEAGDTLSSIGNKYGLDYNIIHQANSDLVTDANMIFVGDLLLIPSNQATSTSIPSSVVVDTPVMEEGVVEQAQSYENNVISQPEQTQLIASNSAKEWIAQKESGGSYTATNGRYIGRYQLDSSYLNGDHSPENQERVADAYVAGRYGSWEAAQAFWMANGWY